MKKVLCLFGIAIVFCDALLWVSLSPDGVYSVSGGEFTTVFLLGILMIMPEAIEQARIFLSSGTSEDIPF